MGLLTLNVLAADTSVSSAHGLLWIAITVIAFIALVISVVNAFRITRIRKMLEVNLMNQKEDIELSFNKIKSTLGRDMGNLRRELKAGGSKPQHPQQNGPKRPILKTDSAQSEDVNETVKPNPTRKPQHRRYPPRKKQNPDSMGAPKSE